LTTLELAFPCSYTRNAEPTSGKCETLDTKSGELMSSCVESEGEGKEVEAGDVADDEIESAGVGCEAKGLSSAEVWEIHSVKTHMFLSRIVIATSQRCFS
jgi:hypothetical protein